MKNLLIFLLFPLMVMSQPQETKVLLYNIGFGGITSGIGATINRNKKDNWKKAFVRGFWQGSLGGAIVYSSKKTMYLVNEKNNFIYALPARVLNCAGNSVIYTAASNKPFLKYWFLEYNFIRADFSVGKRGNLKVRVLPASILTSVVASRKGELDLHTTLLSGVMCFRSKKLISTGRGHFDGINYGRSVVYFNYGDNKIYHVLSHEIIHEFQYRQFLVINSYLDHAVTHLPSSYWTKKMGKYVYADIPYFGLFFMLEGVRPGSAIFGNYFEFEAERFATNRYVPVR